jgi:hypothetical protein
MGTATLIRLTKPRISALILEGTGAVVSVVLALWLLLWFAHRTVPKDHVEAYLVAAADIPPEEAPFQAADVRRFRGPTGAGAIQATAPAELAPEILKKAESGGSPLVVYISAPMLVQGTKGTGEPIAGLIRSVAAESRRDVVLALDLAQVDTDRDLGVFGNSPYSQIQKAIQALDKPSRNIFVMTSAAPAQKSWSADGLGQSIFAYYLRKGLEEEAKGWDGTEPDRITVEGLHRYVLDRVRRWARSRRESVQTPLLLPVLPEGEKPSKVVLQTIPKADSAAGPPVEGRQVAADTKPAKSEAEAKTAPSAQQEKAQDPPAETVRSPMDRLFEEWREHDALAKQTPYREFPGAWRSYEAALLQAERRVRAAHHDSTSWGQLALDALDVAKEQSGRLKTDLQSREKARKEFPFQPAQGDPEGPQKLASALRYLNPMITLPDWLERAAAPAAVPKAGPDKEPGKAGQAQEAASPPILPEAFSISAASEAPPRFLELQLPRWAYRFTEDFNCRDYFHDRGRAYVVLRLVELRGLAERALSTDRRGLSWIKPSIKRGDRERRMIQDKLFGMPNNVQRPDQDPQLPRVVRAYNEALDAIKKFHEARDAWEQAADELPYLAEWAIRIKARSGNGPAALASNPLPESVDQALKALETLARALSPPPANGEGDDEAPAAASRERLRGLTTATIKVREAMGELKRDFDQSTDRYATDPLPGWIEADAALRVPFMPFDKRRSILKKLLSLGDSIAEEDRKAGQAEADSPPDRGFWIRAAGLARLDLELRRLGQGSADADAFEGPTVQKAWTAVSRSPDDRGVAQQTLPSFVRISESVVRLRAATRNGLLQTSGDDAARDLSDVEKDLRAREGQVRYLTATEVEQISKIDGPVRDYARLAECACLEFHLDRLDADHTGERSLNDLAVQIGEIKNSLKIKPSSPLPSRGPGLSVKVTPGGQRDIGEDWKTDFKVIVTGASGTAGEQRPMPDGEAFVGLAAEGVVDGMTVNDRIVGKNVPGERIPVPIEPQAPGEVAFKVDQKTDAVKLQDGSDVLKLDARVFYRGHSDLTDPVRVAVKPNKIPTRIAIRISQDQEALKRKYGDAGRPIPDQFRRHEGEGYMHKGKNLDYVLEIENKTPVPLTVTCKRFLIDDMTGQKMEVKPWIENQVLDPGKPTSLKGKINLSITSDGRPRKLSVEVSDTQGAIPPYTVTFREIGWQDYMELTPRQVGNYSYKKDERQYTEACFVVTMKRDAEDKVTEPIRRDEVWCEFKAENLLATKFTSETEDDPRWFWPGQRVDIYQPLRAVKSPLKWTPQIENEPLKTREENLN